MNKSKTPSTTNVATTDAVAATAAANTADDHVNYNPADLEATRVEDSFALTFDADKGHMLTAEFNVPERPARHEDEVRRFHLTGRLTFEFDLAQLIELGEDATNELCLHLMAGCYGISAQGRDMQFNLVLEPGIHIPTTEPLPFTLMGQ